MRRRYVNSVAAMVTASLLACGMVAVSTSTPAAAAGGVVTNFTGPHINSPAGITTGPDGAMWFTDDGTQSNSYTDTIVRMTTGGTVTNTYTSSTLADPGSITTGPDGALWFTNDFEEATSIGRITTSGSVSSYPLPGEFGGNLPSSIVSGPDGALWFTTDADMIGRVTTAGAFSLYQNSELCPRNIVVGPDGNLWFANGECGPSGAVGSVGRITPSGAITFFTDPTMDNVFSITSGPGSALWYVNAGSDSIGRITTSGSVTNFPLPAGGEPLDIATGPDGALWFTENVDLVGRMTTTGTTTTYTALNDYLGDITQGPDGALWFAETEPLVPGAIGHVTVPTSAPSISGVPTTPTADGGSYSFAFTMGGYPAPTATVTAGSLPPGLSLSSSGTISGTTTTPGSYTATVSAVNGTLPNAMDTFTIVVSGAPTSTVVASSANPSGVRKPVTYRATVNPVPDGGTVAFDSGGSVLSGCSAVAPVNGLATCTTKPTKPGSLAITANYSGDANFGPSSGSLTQVVTNSKTTPVIDSVKFTGTTASPTIVVKGSHFGTEPAGLSDATTECGTYTGNGDDYGTDFYFVDNGYFNAGVGTPPDGACVGLIITKWTASQVKFRFGAAYDTFDHWYITAGDSYTIFVSTSEATGTVTFGR